MILEARHPWILHHARNWLLVLLSFVFLPVSIFVAILAIVLRLFGIVKDARLGPRDAHTARVLVTGVGMMKGLFLARTMYIGGCQVIAADFTKTGNLHCGRFSRAISKFYNLKSPAASGKDDYIQQVLDIIVSDRIDLWISCSGVATAVEDAQLAEAISKLSSCKVIQLNEQAVSTLDDKLNFMQKTTELGLPNLRWHAMASVAEAEQVVHHIRSTNKKGEDKLTKYIVKSASMDDATRGSLPILSSAEPSKILEVTRSLDYRGGRKWILQEFIDSGEEYCTHAVVIDGQVEAFTACPSESVLMHYRALDAESLLFRQMFQFTKDYARGLGQETGAFTGHLSFDFLLRYDRIAGGFTGSLLPIECNPRCHTATVLFRGSEADLASVYLSALDVGSKRKGTGGDTLTTGNGIRVGYYWMAHDIVALVVVPLLSFLWHPTRPALLSLVQSVLDGLSHLLTWKDPTFEWWDPIPWLVLNHVYWPVELLLASRNGVKWKELNVSTTKMFKM